MNLKLLLFVVVVVVVGSSVFLWLLWQPPTPQQPRLEQTVGNDEVVAETPIAGRGSMAELLRMRQNVECTVTQLGGEGAGDTEGTAFFSEGRLRGDFITVVDGAPVLSSMIVAAQRMYVWSEIDGQSYGVQMAVNSETEMSDEDSLDAREPVSLEADVRYDCKPWLLVDNSVFAPPGDVLFRDLDQIRGQGMEYGTVFTQ